MSKVLVITAGEYSDYHIEAVFSEDQLEKAMLYISNSPGSRLEEYVLNEEFTVCDMPRWDVSTELHTGETSVNAVEHNILHKGEAEENCRLTTWADSHSTSNMYVKRIKEWDELRGICKAPTEEHARRHFEELRRQILAGQLPACVKNVDSYQRCLAIERGRNE